MINRCHPETIVSKLGTWLGFMGRRPTSKVYGFHSTKVGCNS